MKIGLERPNNSEAFLFYNRVPLFCRVIPDWHKRLDNISFHLDLASELHPHLDLNYKCPQKNLGSLRIGLNNMDFKVLKELLHSGFQSNLFGTPFLVQSLKWCCYCSVQISDSIQVNQGKISPPS